MDLRGKLEIFKNSSYRDYDIKRNSGCDFQHTYLNKYLVYILISFRDTDF